MMLHNYNWQRLLHIVVVMLVSFLYISFVIEIRKQQKHEKVLCSTDSSNELRMAAFKEENWIDKMDYEDGKLQLQRNCTD